MARLRLEIVTAERQVYSDEVDEVVAPGAAGELGILPRHAALVAILQPGELRVRKDNEELDLAIGGGFIEVHANHVLVLADTAEREDEIDLARAEQAQQRAQQYLASAAQAPQEDLAEAVAELRRSQARIKVARRRRDAASRRPTSP